ncbi:cleavage and polyadenylation specificity factor subunit 6-like [Schistocerca cancellata]|uniref:cleavage and polyadenylation specificity factor subunit 6-like n=1 Tax=Schistocerca cancellata TaxID=274614 RepID=UPI0021180E8F|nr:cleavage and polyadenylation specificity factor subunit 6-like [Schistocerca cancellata]
MNKTYSVIESKIDTYKKLRHPAAALAGAEARLPTATAAALNNGDVKGERPFCRPKGETSRAPCPRAGTRVPRHVRGRRLGAAGGGDCTPPPPPPPPPLLLTPFNGPSWPGAAPLPPPALFTGAAMPPRPTKGGRQVGVAREARAPHSAEAAPLQL